MTENFIVNYILILGAIMATKMTKAEKAEAREKLEKSASEILLSLDELVERNRQAVVNTYSSVKIKSVNSHGMAQKLSERFHNLRVTVEFDNGRQTISIEPMKVTLSVNSFSGYDPEKAVQHAHAVANEGEKYWPHVDTVKAFADGYECALMEKQRSDDLRRSLDEERRNNNVTAPFYMVPRNMRSFGLKW